MQHTALVILHNVVALFTGCSNGNPLFMLDVACTFYSQAIKRLCCQVALVDKFNHARVSNIAI